MHEPPFFGAAAPAGQVPEVDAGETTALAGLHPPQAPARMRAGSAMRRAASLRVWLPDQGLSGLPNAASKAALETAMAAPISRIEPVGLVACRCQP